MKTRFHALGVTMLLLIALSLIGMPTSHPGYANEAFPDHDHSDHDHRDETLLHESTPDRDQHDGHDHEQQSHAGHDHEHALLDLKDLSTD